MLKSLSKGNLVSFESGKPLKRALKLRMYSKMNRILYIKKIGYRENHRFNGNNENVN